ncbi:MAG: ComF family protein, partial [Bacteroidales bacterium]|nr:ComF family protein [Bacteroidales bacterium]
CMACGKSLYKNENCLCTYCLYHLPKTNFHLEKDNEVERVFWGRVRIESAASFLYFSKGGKVQKIMHKLKYKGRQEIGVFLGEQYGLELLNSDTFKNIDIIIPVPLHKMKLKKRGYNQSEKFAEGLSLSMKKPVSTDNLYRKIFSETQTKKTRYKRWQNVESIFDIKNPELLKSKHILLVDDVITTGATMEACVNVLKKVEDIKISIASIAYASNL